MTYSQLVREYTVATLASFLVCLFEVLISLWLLCMSFEDSHEYKYLALDYIL